MDLPSYYFDPRYFFTPIQNFEEIIIETLCLGHKYNKPLIPIIQRTHTLAYARRKKARFKNISGKKSSDFWRSYGSYSLITKNIGVLF